VDLVGALSHPCWEVQRLLDLAERWIHRPRGTSRRRPAVRTFRHLRGSEVDQLVAKYKAGSTVYELGELYGINRQTVGKHLRQRGVDTRAPGARARRCRCRSCSLSAWLVASRHCGSVRHVT
jgi:hypothetical protein